jgi:hypothetical protein
MNKTKQAAYVLVVVSLLMASCRVPARVPGALEPGSLPESGRTPGATMEVSRDDVCTPGYTKKVRDVPASIKRRVFAEYGIVHPPPRAYEVDHLISLELGGSNSVRNLWPEPYSGIEWNAHVKDALEDRLHSMVCKGEIEMSAAQDAIATDWIAAYKRYFHTNEPLPKRQPKQTHRKRRARRGSQLQTD